LNLQKKIQSLNTPLELMEASILGLYPGVRFYNCVTAIIISDSKSNFQQATSRNPRLNKWYWRKILA